MHSERPAQSAASAGISSRGMRLGLMTLLAWLVLIAGDASSASSSVPTKSCGFQSFGKGWYLNASRNVSCDSARKNFHSYFTVGSCNRLTTGTCAVGQYGCRFNFRDDVERATCTSMGRLIAFRSVE
jgi:hypothetical protein